MKEVVVIGAGLGGLSAALRLAAGGWRVTLLEKNAAVGGKIGRLEESGYVFDTGPTLLTMPFVLRELFESLGERLEDHVDCVPVDPLCRYFFSDGSRLDIPNAPERLLEAVHHFNPSEVSGVRRLLARGKEIYELASEPFLFHNPGEWSLSYLGIFVKALARFWKLDAWRTLDESVRADLRDVRLVQVFDRFATYSGSSPYCAPATFAIIPYVEWTMGGWYVRGGLYRIAQSLSKLAVKRGVGLRTGIACEKIQIERNRVAGVRLADGTSLKTSTVIVNADALYAYERLIRDDRMLSRFHANGRRQALPTSGFILLLGVDRTYEELAHHNIFFSSDYRKEFEDIFSRGVPPEEPTVYVSVSSKADPSMAPPGASNFFVMVNVPPVGQGCVWSEKARPYRQVVLERLKRFGLADLEQHIRFERMLTPVDFEAQYGAYRGALYGFASNSPWSAFRRPANRDPRIRGLYFAGGSTHPGGGIPLVLLSGKLTAEAVQKHEGKVNVGL